MIDRATPSAVEVNFDGVIGPTHAYAGLSYGNIASQSHGGTTSSPRAAALQGLAKMKRLADLGVRQAVLPPQERPDMSALRRLGFVGPDAAVLEQARKEDPALLAACCSASSMWAANAATVSPSSDSSDGLVHFTPANLLAQFHRSLEPPTTGSILRSIFANERYFAHHPPLPPAALLSDEGAANHMRLCTRYGGSGLQVFVYGRSGLRPELSGPRKFPARQTLEASAAIARLHLLPAAAALFLQQNPTAIDAGAFHNDVVAVSNLNLLFFHELAFADGADAVKRLRDAFGHLSGDELTPIEVTQEQVPLADAVASYLFNSQLVLLADGTSCLIAPVECRQTASVRTFVSQLLASGGPIRTVHYTDVRQSMRNGGGPACLRLRVVLTSEELAAMHAGVLFDNTLHDRLSVWICRHYREQLHADDLADPSLLDESRRALDELTQILKLGTIYPFQRA